MLLWYLTKTHQRNVHAIRVVPSSIVVDAVTFNWKWWWYS